MFQKRRLNLILIINLKINSMTSFEVIQTIITIARKKEYPKDCFLNVSVKSKKEFMVSMNDLFTQNPHVLIAKPNQQEHPSISYAGYKLFITQDTRQVHDVECKQVEFNLNLRTIEQLMEEGKSIFSESEILAMAEEYKKRKGIYQTTSPKQSI